MIHSPFHVVENFISPLQCEHLVQQLGLKAPNTNEFGQAKHERLLPPLEAGPLLGELDALSPLLEKRYGGSLAATPNLLFQQYWENPKLPAEPHWAEGWDFKRKKWNKIKDINLVGFIWLKDYHDAVPLDPRFEVYGGKLEFPAYNFSLVPVRGTLIMYPATPHFVTAMSHVMLGSLEQIKVTMKLSGFDYSPAKFPGSYQEWFTQEE